MRFPLVTRRRYDRDIALKQHLLDQARDKRDNALADWQTAVFNREQVVRQNADLDAANRRLLGRNLELGRRLIALAESDPEYAAALERRVARLRKVGVRVLAAWSAEKARGDHLQARYDDAVGLGSGRIEDSRSWQPGYVEPKENVS